MHLSNERNRLHCIMQLAPALLSVCSSIAGFLSWLSCCAYKQSPASLPGSVQRTCPCCLISCVSSALNSHVVAQWESFTIWDPRWWFYNKGKINTLLNMLQVPLVMLVWSLLECLKIFLSPCGCFKAQAAGKSLWILSSLWPWLEFLTSLLGYNRHSNSDCTILSCSCLSIC